MFYSWAAAARGEQSPFDGIVALGRDAFDAAVRASGAAAVTRQMRLKAIPEATVLDQPTADGALSTDGVPPAEGRRVPTKVTTEGGKEGILAGENSTPLEPLENVMFLVSAEDLAELKRSAQQGLPEGHWISSQVMMSMTYNIECLAKDIYLLGDDLMQCLIPVCRNSAYMIRMR